VATALHDSLRPLVRLGFTRCPSAPFTHGRLGASVEVVALRLFPLVLRAVLPLACAWRRALRLPAAAGADAGLLGRIPVLLPRLSRQGTG